MTSIPRARGPRKLEEPGARTAVRTLLGGSGVGPRIVLLAILLFTACMMLWSHSRRTERLEREAAAAAQEAAASVPRAASEEELAERRRTNSLAFEGALNDTVNGDGFIETPGYRKLIEIVASSRPEDVSQRATYFDHAAAMLQPDMLRGEYVRQRGLLGGLFAYKLDVPVHDIADVWRGTISQPDGELETTVFDLVSDPPPLELQRSVVEVEGVLYRTVAYESTTGARREAPYLIVRNVHVLSDKTPQGGPSKLAITAAGTGAIAAYLLLRRGMRKRNTRGPRKAPGFKQLFEDSRSAERSRQTPAGPKGS